MIDKGRISFWIVASMAAIALFAGLGGPRLMDPDEARFARTSVEMSSSGDIVVPVFEGAPRTAKPPLLNWLQIILFRTLGTTELMARLPSALSTLGSLFLVAWVARRRFGDEGAAWAAAVFITSPLVFVEGRLGSIDALLTVHVFAAIALDIAEPDETASHRGPAIGALLGLAFLAKGPVGVVLPLLVMLAGRTAAGRSVVPRRKTWLSFAAAWCVVVLPWGLAFAKRLGGGGTAALLRKEVLERYFAGTMHPQPPWYYAAVVAVGFSPWLVPLVFAVVRSLGRRRDPAARTALYAGAGLLAGLLFLSLGQGKLPQYILPLAPLVAILVTWELGQELSAPRESWAGPLLLTGTLLAAATGLGAVAAVRVPDAIRTTAAVGALAHGLAAVAALAGLFRQRPRVVYGAAATASVALLVAASLVLHPWLGWLRSAAPLIEAVPAMRSSERPLVTAGVDLPSLSFYLDRIPERVPIERLEARLERGDDPIVVMVEKDLSDVPHLDERLVEIGRAGKLRAYEVLKDASRTEGENGSDSP